MSTLAPDIDTLKQQANQAFATGKFNAAIDLYTAALTANNTTNTLEPSLHAILLSNRAAAHVKLENYGSAIEDANQAIKLDPKYLKSYYRKGSAYVGLGKYKEAAAAFRQVVKLKPNDPDATAKLAECDKLVKLQAFAEAIASPATRATWEEVEELVKTLEVDNSYDWQTISTSFLHLYYHANGWCSKNSLSVTIRSKLTFF